MFSNGKAIPIKNSNRRLNNANTILMTKGSENTNKEKDFKLDDQGVLSEIVGLN